MKIKGKFRQYRTHLDDTFFLVAPFYITHRDGVRFSGLITATGVMHEKPFDMELDYELEGELVTDSRFGEQFKFTSYMPLLPSKAESIIKYIINSPSFETIGLMEAKRIVDHFGDNLFEEIYENPKLVDKFEATEELKEKIRNGVFRQYRKFKLDKEFIRLGILQSLANKLMPKILYQEKDPIEQLKDGLSNLYFDGTINFAEFKHLFEKLGMDDELVMLSIAVYYTIESLINEGSATLLEYDKTVAYLQSYLSKATKSLTIIDVLNKLIEKDGKVIKIGNYLTLDYFYKFETSIVNKLNGLLETKNDDYVSLGEASKLLNKYQVENKVSFDKVQTDAILSAVKNPVAIISGGPGTGKSTLISALHYIFANLKSVTSIALIAPTGRVAKRIGNAADTVALTFHRYLGLNFSNLRFEKPNRKDEIEIIIIDEFSMVGTVLFYLMFAGTPNLKKLILLGDSNQLPSIDAGNLLSDLIGSNRFNLTNLITNYRQGEGSTIVEFANQVLLSIEPKNDANPYKYIQKDEVIFLNAEDTEISNIVSKLATQLEAANGLSWQVIAPKHSDPGGVIELNQAVQKLNKNKPIKVSTGSTFEVKVGDKLIHTINDTASDLYNGDIGVISSLHLNSKKVLDKIEIDFDNKSKVIEKRNVLKRFELGYAITIHKAQGSEFDYVIISIPTNAKRMLYNNLVYTALTRAKKKLVIVGKRESFDNAIKTKLNRSRMTLVKKLFDE